MDSWKLKNFTWATGHPVITKASGNGNGQVVAITLLTLPILVANLGSGSF